VAVSGTVSLGATYDGQPGQAGSVTFALPPEDAELEALELLLDEALLLEDEVLLAVELLEDDVPAPGTEHSLTPPATRVPVPKVASLQTKLPLSVM